MTLTRRDLVSRGALLVAAGLTAPSFLARTALALHTDTAAARPKILVAVQLSGGNDGLNTLIPFADPGYYQLRSSLAIPTTEILPLTDSLGLHPRLANLKALYDQGIVAVVQGVGYPNPNRSHFRSMDIWHSARPDTFDRSGWLGRYLDACQCGRDQPLPAISAGDQLNTMFYTDSTLVPAVASIGAFSLRTETGQRNDRQLQIQTLRNIYQQAGNWSPHEVLIRKTALQALDTAEQLHAAAANYQSPVSYPDNALANQLKMVAQIISANLATRLFSVQLGGFDTHAAQVNQQANLLGQLAEALDAFVRDLDALGKQDDVLVMTFSEFGRRAAQNGSAGTDHGTAEPMFLIGTGIRSGLHGAYPSLQDLDDNGDLKFSTDFRQVYAAVLRDHLGVDPTPVLAGSHSPVDVIRAA
ncbi:MAG TPA: DUF1501 domain-containing protein [Chloroflexota bacterium]|nr:DUF1501 domain-containing protein [Chloroflexota bacterium]